MKPSDFFIEIPDDNWNMHDEFNAKMADQLRTGKLSGHSDMDAGYALARLMKTEFTTYGTNQSDVKCTNDDSALAMRALKAVLRRLSVPFEPPFNDFEGWFGYWSAEGMTHSGSWALRRGYINELFTPVLTRLEELEDAGSGPAGFRGVDGEMKNIIFASTGYKPEIVLRDAINNTIEIVKYGETCLIYNRPLTDAGLTWADLVSWWRETQNLKSASDSIVGQDLFKRLLASVGKDSPPEEVLFRAYCEWYGGDENLMKPALLPQVYLYYDPLTHKERQLLEKPERLGRERMDFVLVFPGGIRIVLEVDGQQHYSENGEPSPALYSAMMAEDRELRLRGYEVFRFGGSELKRRDAPEMLRAFFTSLDGRYGNPGK
jgi:very-short-patch-repair endonuclease